MKTSIRLMTVLLITATVASCGMKGIKVPADKLDYVGLWTSLEVRLFIHANGRVEYEKNTGGSKKSISAPIQKFEGNNFVVGALGINTTFVVSETPHRDSSGVWKMTVDGVELTRTIQ